MGWKNPLWNSLRGPDSGVLRRVFLTLEQFLSEPTFQNGIQLGSGETPTYDPGLDVVVQPPTTTVTAATISGIEAALPPDDGLSPAQVTGLALTPGVRSLFAAWTEAAEVDVQDGWGEYVVEVDDDPGFGTPVVSKRVGGTQTAVTGLTTGTTYYVRVAAVDAYGNQGSWSASASTAPVEVDTPDIAADAITANEILANTITAAEIAADTITAEELAAISVEVGKWIQSDSYDGTDVETADATTGWRAQGNGLAEFAGVRVRGEITASEFHGADVTNLLADGGFESGVSGFVADTVGYAGSVVAQTAVLVRTGAAAMRIYGTSGASCAAYRSISCAPGDIIYASGWVRKTSVSGSPNEHRNEVVLNINFLDGGSYVQFNTTRTVISGGSWVFVELYAAAPVGFPGIDEARIAFSHSYNTGNYLYVDDAQVGFAPLLEVPYIVTNEDDEIQRARVLPHEIGFDGPQSSYPFGLRADRFGNLESRLRIAGPYDSLGDAAIIDLTNDMFGGDAVEVATDSMTVNGVEVHELPHSTAANVAPAGTITSASYVNLPTTRCRVVGFEKVRADTDLIVEVYGHSSNSGGLNTFDVAVDIGGTDTLVDSCLGVADSQHGTKIISGLSAGSHDIEVQGRVSAGTQTITGRWSLRVTETY